MSNSTHEPHLSGADLDALIAQDPTNIQPPPAVARHLSRCIPCFGDFLVKLVNAHPRVDAELHFNALAQAIPSETVH